MFACWYVAPPGECYYNTLLCCDYLSSLRVVSRSFSVLCMYSKFGHHAHPPGYLWPNFISSAASIAELAHGEKSCTQSLTSPIQLISCQRNRSACTSEYVQNNQYGVQNNRRNRNTAGSLTITVANYQMGVGKQNPI